MMTQLERADKLLTTCQDKEVEACDNTYMKLTATKDAIPKVYNGVRLQGYKRLQNQNKLSSKITHFLKSNSGLPLNSPLQYV